ncbi:RxLR effector protein, partial [Phytophthora megakarya]
MHHHYLVCLVFLVSGVLIGADSALIGPKNTLLLPDTYKRGGIAISRLLRTNKPPFEGDQEERVGGFSISEKVKSMFASSSGTPEKLQKWFEKKTSVDIVFKNLHLNKAGYPFDKPNFAAWVDYANALSAKVPKMSAISTLTKHYGDETLYNIIQRAKTRTYTKDRAIELEAAQMQHWIKMRKDPDEIFRLLQLNWKGRKVFENPEFITWAKYVDDLTTKHPEEPTLMYSTLTKYFDDDVLFKMTNVGKDSTQTKSVAIKVEDDWVQAILQKHKTPHQLLQNLGLGKTTDNLLDKVMYDNSLIRTWGKYLEVFNRRYPEEKTTMMETFTKAFGDDGVVKMLHTARSKSWTRDLAGQMETTQLRMWLDSGKTTDDVFNLLKLDKEVNTYHFRDKQLLSTWVSYINVFIEK